MDVAIFVNFFVQKQLDALINTITDLGLSVSLGSGPYLALSSLGVFVMGNHHYFSVSCFLK